MEIPTLSILLDKFPAFPLHNYALLDNSLRMFRRIKTINKPLWYNLKVAKKGTHTVLCYAEGGCYAAICRYSPLQDQYQNPWLWLLVAVVTERKRVLFIQ